jgi:hypothetical protein
MKPRRPYIRAEPGYNPRGGRPPLDVDFVAVCDAIRGAWAGSGETVTSIAARFGVSRGWIHKWVYPAIGDERLNKSKQNEASGTEG